MRPGLLKTALLLIAIGCLAAGCNRAVHVKSNGRRAVIALMDSAESVMNDAPEYGHFMQARGWGGFSALSGGIFSLFGAFNKGSFWGINHEQLWIERDASIRGAEHLSEEFEKKENKLILLKEHYNKNYPQDYYDLRMLHNMFIPFSVGFGIYNIIVPN